MAFTALRVWKCAFERIFQKTSERFSSMTASAQLTTVSRALVHTVRSELQLCYVTSPLNLAAKLRRCISLLYCIVSHCIVLYVLLITAIIVAFPYF